MTDPTSRSPQRTKSGGQIAALVGGGIAGMLALAALVAGGLLLWADSRTDHDGYLTTKTDRYQTRTYAIATDNLDVEGDVPGVVNHDVFGKLRLRVTPHGDKPVFVGIARTHAVSRYLDDSAHATLTDVDFDPFKPGLPRRGGHQPPAASGAAPHLGRVRAGRRRAVADLGRRVRRLVGRGDERRRLPAGVDAGVSAGARIPWIAPAGWGALGGGVLLALARRRPAVRRRAPAAAAAAAGSAPLGQRGDHRLVDAGAVRPRRHARVGRQRLGDRRVARRARWRRARTSPTASAAPRSSRESPTAMQSSGA